MLDKNMAKECLYTQASLLKARLGELEALIQGIEDLPEKMPDKAEADISAMARTIQGEVNLNRLRGHIVKLEFIVNLTGCTDD